MDERMPQIRERLLRRVAQSGRIDAANGRTALDEVFDEIEREGAPLDPETRAELAATAFDHLFDYGPLYPLMRDGDVTEVMINGPYHVFVEKGGRITASDVRFASEGELRALIERFLQLTPGKRLDNALPITDLSLPDGTRVNLAIPPVVPTSPHLTLRKYTRAVRSLDDYVAMGSMDRRVARLLEAAVHARINLLLSGGAGTGKTTLLEVLSGHMAEHERIVVIEDTLELRLRQANVVRLLTRGRNIEGKGEITIRELFRASLRMRPTRILLGEIRGEEAFDFLQAATSGHRGTCAVFHAATPEEAVIRLENLVPLAGHDVPTSAVRRQIAQGLDLVVQLDRNADGARVVSRVTEIDGLDDDGFVRTRDLVRWETSGVDAHGRVTGKHVPQPALTKWVDRMRLRGVPVDAQVG